jgi:hypothetical protein
MRRYEVFPAQAIHMLLKIPATRTPQGALKFVALIIKILSCNKNFFFHGLRSKLPQLFYFRGTLKDVQTQFLRLFHKTHIVSQAAVPDL